MDSPKNPRSIRIIRVKTAFSRMNSMRGIVLQGRLCAKKKGAYRPLRAPAHRQAAQDINDQKSPVTIGKPSAAQSSIPPR